jgi:hypothetical protein
MISCLKSWGVFIDEEERVKKEEKQSKDVFFEEDNPFIILVNE